MATTRRSTSPNASPMRAAKRVQRSPGCRDIPNPRANPRGSAGESGDAISKKRHGKEGDEHERDRRRAPLEPGARSVEDSQGKSSRHDEQDQGEGERQERDEREEQPLDHVAVRGAVG